MKRLLSLLAPAALLLAGLPAHAVIGVPDQVPAATLLLPYFEVDLDDPNNASTTLTVQNVQPSAGILGVTLWTDLGIPTLSVPIYLTGYDATVLDLRLLFQAGLVEPTASAGQDPGDAISPKGMYSQDINFASCYRGSAVGLPRPRMSATALDNLRKAHTGQASATFGGACGASPHGDHVARGYVTLDDMTQCTPEVPTSPGYFNGATSARNVWTGQYTFMNRREGLASSGSLVAIEASDSHPMVSTPAQPTFYGALVNWQATDRRESLPRTWQARFINAGAPTTVHGGLGGGTTHLVVWREPLVRAQPFPCDAMPESLHTPHAPVLAFDEEENATLLTGSLFPLVTQRVNLASPEVGLPTAAGFLVMDLANPTATTGSPGSSWVTTLVQAPAAGMAINLPANPVESAPSGPFQVSRLSGVTSTGGRSFTFTVTMNDLPLAPVSLPVTVSNPAQVDVSPATLEFTPSDIWGKEVTVTGKSGPNLGNAVVQVLLGPSQSTEPTLNGIRPPSVRVLHQLDSAFTVSAVSGAVTATGGSATFMVNAPAYPPRLSEPAFPLRLRVSSSRPEQATVTPSEVVFNGYNNPAVQVTVTGRNDGSSTGSVPFTVRLHPVIAEDPLLMGIDPPDVDLVNVYP